jgi:hypothetical protein
MSVHKIDYISHILLCADELKLHVQDIKITYLPILKFIKLQIFKLAFEAWKIS